MQVNAISNKSNVPSLLDLASFHRNGSGGTGISGLNVIITFVSHGCCCFVRSLWKKSTHTTKEMLLVAGMWALKLVDGR
jgi:hypothetical protein